MPRYYQVRVCCTDSCILLVHSAGGYSGCFHFGLLWLVLLWMFTFRPLWGHVFSLLMGPDLGVELPESYGNYLPSRGAARLFFKGAAPFYIPTHSVGGHRWVRVSADTCYYSVCLTGHKVVPRGFDLHFPMVNGVEQSFVCLLAVCISSAEKCLFWSSGISNWVVFFIIEL